MPVLTPEQVADPSYVFEQGREFVEIFGEHIGAALIDPIQDPLTYAERVAQLNPRHSLSVFNPPKGDHTAEYMDRYAQADNGLPAWAAAQEDVIYAAADPLGIRSREIGSTFQHNLQAGHYGVGLVLEGANKQDITRGFAMAEAIKDGIITVDQVAVAVTDRFVKEREGHDGIRVGYGVGGKAVAAMADKYSDIFGPDGVRLGTLDIRTHKANTRDVVAEAALRLNAGSIAMTGSNIYGSWMRIDMATAAHSVNGLKRVDFGAGLDDPKAARTPRIWAAEVSQTLVSAAYLQHAYNTKSR